jgi:hypothetical protein
MYAQRVILVFHGFIGYLHPVEVACVPDVLEGLSAFDAEQDTTYPSETLVHTLRSRLCEVCF